MTTVRFPTKIRLELVDDRLDDPETTASIVRASGAAIHRAVDRARTVELVRSATPDPSNEPRISVRLTGDRLPEALARRLATDLSGIARAEAIRLLARPAEAATAGPRDPATDYDAGRGERFNPRRAVIDDWSSDRDAYLVRSYDAHGGPGKVAAQGQKNPPKPVRMHLRLKHFTSMEALEAAIAAKYGAAPPRRLVVATADDHGRPIGSLLLLDGAGKVVGGHVMGRWEMFVPASDEGAAHKKAWSFFKADVLKFVKDAPTVKERRAMREAVLIRLMTEGAAEAGSSLTEADITMLAKQLVRQMPDPGVPVRYYNLMSGGDLVQVIELDHTELAPEDLPVAVFTVEVPDTDGHGRPGTSGATGGLTECPDLPVEGVFGFTPDPEHPFMQEPPVEWWPATISVQFSHLMEDIARAVDMEPGRFPGMFLMAAAVKVTSRASSLGSLVGAGDGSKGPREPEIAKLASAFVAMSSLETLYTRVIAMADEGHTLPCPVGDNSASWLLHFYDEYFPRRDEAIKAIFVATCQDILLGVLESSHYEIVRRLKNFDAYMKVTRVLILLMLVDVTDLLDLRDMLASRSGITWTTVAVATAGGPIVAWYESAKAVVTLLDRPPVDTSGPPKRGRIATMKDGPRIQDATGRWWSKEELDSVIAGGKEQAFAVDPMLEKLSNLPEVVERLKNAGYKAIDTEFHDLLGDIQSENEAKTRDVREDNSIAFGLATFKEADINSNSDIGAELSGIHAKADARLRPMFSGNAEDAYVSGMRTLVSSELGYSSFMTFFNIVGLTAIAILCPPAAFAIGAAEAVHGLSDAFEHEGIQEAMLGGDEILSKAQVEAEMWGACIGAALTFIPEVPGLLRGASGGVKAIVKGEAREAAVVASKQAFKAAAEHLAELAAADLATAFAKECLKGYLLNLALQGAIGRITEAVAREVAVSGHASIGDLPQILSAAVSGPPPQLAGGVQ